MSLESLRVTLHEQKTIVCLERKGEVHLDEYMLLRVQLEIRFREHWFIDINKTVNIF